MKLSSKYSPTTHRQIDLSAKDLYRKIAAYLSGTPLRSSEALLKIIENHFVTFDKFFDLRFVREEEVTLSETFDVEKVMRAFDVLEILNEREIQMVNKFGTTEVWTLSYDPIQIKFSVSLNGTDDTLEAAVSIGLKTLFDADCNTSYIYTKYTSNKPFQKTGDIIVAAEEGKTVKAKRKGRPRKKSL